MAALEAARQVAAEKRVMKDKLWDHDDRIDEFYDAPLTSGITVFLPVGRFQT